MADCEECNFASYELCDLGRILQALCKKGDIELLDATLKKYDHALPINMIAFEEDNLEVIKYINETQPNLIVHPIEVITIKNMEVDRYLFYARPELYAEKVLRNQLYDVAFCEQTIGNKMFTLRYLHTKPGMTDIDMDFNKMNHMHHPYEIAEFIFSNFKFGNFMEALDNMDIPI